MQQDKVHARHRTAAQLIEACDRQNGQSRERFMYPSSSGQFVLFICSLRVGILDLESAASWPSPQPHRYWGKCISARFTVRRTRLQTARLHKCSLKYRKFTRLSDRFADVREWPRRTTLSHVGEVKIKQDKIQYANFFRILDKINNVFMIRSENHSVRSN